jgi:predicted secreted Zn-dependent protease
MRITYLLAALLLVSSLATPTTAQERGHKSVARTQAYGIEGREIAAPSWSAACITDHGPSEFGEPMWIYGSSGAQARYRNAF